MLIYWSGLYLIATRRSTPLSKISKQIVCLMHLVGAVFLLCSSLKEALSITTLMYAFQTVDKSDQDLLKVSNCANELSLPRSRLRINMSTSGPITNRSLAGWVPKDRYDGDFQISLHLITFLLASRRCFLIAQGSLNHPASIMDLVMCITNNLSFA